MHAYKIPRTLIIVILVLVIGILLTALNVYELHRMQKEHIYFHQGDTSDHVGPTKDLKHSNSVVWVYAKRIETGYLKHVINVFQRTGYALRDKETHWDVLWTHDYPFAELKMALSELKSYQKVNHFPGTGYITNKVNLATSSLKYVPKAFRLPNEKNQLLEYSQRNSEKLWVQKSNNHRGIRIQKLQDMDLTSEDTFIQEYIQNPMLISGRKFDIGVYAVLTSINPLRVFTYDSDILLRFCPEPYHPFDPQNLNKYVIGDDYTPTWQIPALKKYYNENKLTFKETLNSYLRSIGKDPEELWIQMKRAISGVYKSKENNLIRSAMNFKSTRNFFEMVRFDFVVDEDLNVFIMEANMSPNLSSAHFAENQLLYERVLFSLLSLVGIARSIHSSSLKPRSEDETTMQVAERDIMVFGELCSSAICLQSCNTECQLCNRCLSDGQRRMLKDAYLEHVNRLSCRRIVPEPLNHGTDKQVNNLSEMSSQNSLMALWFQGKCKQDASWCT